MIGGGVVGSAIAHYLSSNLPPHAYNICVLEKSSSPGQGISSRNSGVIHASLYYPPGSLKSRLCLSGRLKLLSFCSSHRVPFSLVGKVLTAHDAPGVAKLKALSSHSVSVGVSCPLEFLPSRESVQEFEPNVDAIAGLRSPGTGIVDVQALISSLLCSAKDTNEVDVACNSEVTGIREDRQGGKIVLTVTDKREGPYEMECSTVINAAGLEAPNVFSLLQRGATDEPAAAAAPPPPRHYFCKGHYFKLRGRSPFNGLVYPLPPVDGSGLGIHSTLDLDGGVRFGPDVEWLDASVTDEKTLDYRVDEARMQSFVQAIRQYYPKLKDDDLYPDYSGVRPKLTPPPGKGASGKNMYNGGTDFRIDGFEEHRIPGLVNLFGIESPGVTSSLAIAEEVFKKLGWKKEGQVRNS